MSGAGLTPQHFSEFFRAIHGLDPFPWQERLALTLCTSGTWPDTLDLPTGTGKTACIDVALFHLAYDLANHRERRRAPLRIVWVVDRRLIVDDAFDRGVTIAKRLQRADSGILKTIAEVFHKIAGPNEPPLVVRRLRGGLPQEGDWTRTPTQPTVLSSTVDQAGSRLLFRGYGVTPRMRPIHAGLLGEDALFVLDEVHLSEPFRQTVARVASIERPSEAPWRFVQLSATPRAIAGTSTTFTLDAGDRANPVLERRLSAAKPAALVSLGRVGFGSWEHAERFADHALAQSVLAGGAAKNVLVVVNRVHLARRVHAILSRRTKAEFKGDSLTLLIGRSRNVDKDLIRTFIVDRCRSRPQEDLRGEEHDPVIVVATQCVEAGADLDFDGLVTQIASFDALQQRFGRLNRMGRPIEARAAILAVDAEVAASAKPDPIYGLAMRRTWSWLRARAEVSAADNVDFAAGSLGIAVSGLNDLDEMRSPRTDSPLLMPQHLAALARTYPAPPWSPDPALYLHGTPNAPADVNIVWRADLPPDTVEQNARAAAVSRILELVPVRSGETLALPLRVVRRWLRGQPSGDVADVERDVTEDEGAASAAVGMAWRVRNADDDVQPVVDGAVRPGDTIVLPCSAGGCDEYGWNPQRSAVHDVAFQASLPYARTRYAVRLHPGLLAQEIERASAETEKAYDLRVVAQWQRIAAIVAEYDDNANDAVRALLDSARDLLPESWRSQLELLCALSFRRLTVAYPYESADDEASGRNGFVFLARNGARMSDAVPVKTPPSIAERLRPSRSISESATELDTLGCCGTIGSPLELERHVNDVEAQARSSAERLRLTGPIADDVCLAAYLHDAGKADRRFQQYLIGGPWVSATLFAKSGQRRSRAEDASARRSAQLPNGWRHEALSVRIAREHPRFAQANDPELVLWLIGTHHGFGRPLFEHDEPRDDQSGTYGGITIPPSAGPQRIDFSLSVPSEEGIVEVDWASMFTRLEVRYGSWGLARLESIVRLADHRASEAPTTSAQAPGSS